MKNEKLYPKEKQKGVVFYRNKLASQDMSEDPEDIDAIDIDVDDEVKEVVICYDLIMADSKKSFPNVESLVIKSNVFEIRIPNSLFPNVKWVQSERDRFKTGNCLVLDEGNIFCTLLKHSEEGDMVVDCFSGSGTTAVAASNTGRNFVGCELSKEYYDKSIKRLEKMDIDVKKGEAQ